MLLPVLLVLFYQCAGRWWVLVFGGWLSEAAPVVQRLPEACLVSATAAGCCRYGTRAVEQLQRYYQGQISDVMSEDEEAQRGAGAGPAGNRSSNGPAAAAQGARRRGCQPARLPGSWLHAAAACTAAVAHASPPLSLLPTAPPPVLPTLFPQAPACSARSSSRAPGCRPCWSTWRTAPRSGCTTWGSPLGSPSSCTASGGAPPSGRSTCGRRPATSRVGEAGGRGAGACAKSAPTG